jgi:hypothetical protein
VSFLKRGKKTEEEFARLFKDFRRSSASEDMNEHWDIEVKHKIDVKGLKKVRRGDQDVNEHFHWIEIHNVHGKHGWLYGEADFFAFELKDFWVIVPKEDLQKRIAEKTTKLYYDVPTVYGLYQRRNRRDVMTIIPSYDLCSISIAMIEKDGQKL